jgi:hypothetical protein
MSMSFSSSLPAFNVDALCRKVFGTLFGEHIQGIRDEKGLSLDDAAARAGMTVAEWVYVSDASPTRITAVTAQKGKIA